MTALVVIVSALGAYLTAYVLYQLLLFAGNAFIPDPPERAPQRLRRFAVLIPAHDEELLLPRLLASLAEQTYPRAQFQVFVIADNCTDGTARACRPFDVRVLSRTDHERRGKGHAIRWALERMGLEQFDAVVVVDGDSTVGAGLLDHLNLQMDRGDRVIQCFNAVANPQQSWFTRLAAVSRSVSNEVLHPGKRKLGLSSYLMGNGMCFEADLLRSQGWDAFSVGEDWEYYARLIMAGIPVGYSRQARVYHQESVDLRQASSQRLRWSGGRFEVLRRYGLRLFLRGLVRRDVRCLDASLPLVFPNPSLGMNLTLLGLLFSVGGLFLGASVLLTAWYVTLAVLQVGMFMVGVLYTQDRAANAASLVLAPLFLTWKMGVDVVSLCGIGRSEWRRTDRRVP